MAGWEISLIIVALTFMVVNLTNVFIQLKVNSEGIKFLKKYDRLFTKMLFLGEKLIDNVSKELDD